MFQIVCRNFSTSEIKLSMKDLGKTNIHSKSEHQMPLTVLLSGYCVCRMV